MRRWVLCGTICGGLAVAWGAGCSEPTVEPAEQSSADPRVEAHKMLGPMYVIETALGEMRIVLDSKGAPNTAQRFVARAEAGAYDGTLFHRRIAVELIQGGRIEDGDPVEGPLGLETMTTEHVVGAVSMVRREDPEAGPRTPERQEFLESAGSEFFICLNRLPHLNGKYAVFAKVILGIEIARKIGLSKGDIEIVRVRAADKKREAL